jgi:hypothetical protein
MFFSKSPKPRKNVSSDLRRIKRQIVQDDEDED